MKKMKHDWEALEKIGGTVSTDGRKNEEVEFVLKNEKSTIVKLYKMGWTITKISNYLTDGYKNQFSSRKRGNQTVKGKITSLHIKTILKEQKIEVKVNKTKPTKRKPSVKKTPESNKQPKVGNKTKPVNNSSFDFPSKETYNQTIRGIL